MTGVPIKRGNSDTEIVMNTGRRSYEEIAGEMAVYKSRNS